MKNTSDTLQIEITVAQPNGRSRSCRTKAPNAPEPPRIPRIARLMALAIKFQDIVDRGEVRDYADLARLGYVSRARITQIMNMLNLAPDIQERLLTSPIALNESRIRAVVRHVLWEQQRSAFSPLH